MQLMTKAEPWVAALPMYDLVELKPATDRFWQALRDRLDQAGIADLPQTLSRPDRLTEFWCQPNLLLSQTCGYPLVTELRDAVQLVATPVYSAPGCEGRITGASLSCAHQRNFVTWASCAAVFARSTQTTAIQA